MENACKKIFSEKLRPILLLLKRLASDAFSTKKRILVSSAVILILVLTLVLVFILAATGREKPMEEPADVPADAQIKEVVADPVPVETQPIGIPATMGTVTADQLSICKDPGFEIDVDEYYAKGDRVEIHETKAVNGALWGYTGKGWVSMSCVRMDDVPPNMGEPAGPDGVEIVSSGSYAVLGYGVVDLGSLNVRVGPGTDYTKIGEVHEGVRYAYYEEFDDWVRIGDGWVSTEYFYVEGTTAEDATAGTVTTNDLNVRSGPDTTFKRVSSYMENDAVQLLAVVNGWGYTEKGWISMIYVELPEPVYTTGSATVTIGLNIREEPDPTSAKVDTYKEGDRVTILEVKGSWGRTDKGWISLDYVKYD